MAKTVEEEVEEWVAHHLSQDVTVAFIETLREENTIKNILRFSAVLMCLKLHKQQDMFVTPNTLPYVINRYMEINPTIDNVKQVSEQFGETYLSAKCRTSPLDNLTLRQFIDAATRGVEFYRAHR